MHPLVNVLASRWALWHEGHAAARMLVAALVAYAASTMLHIPGPYSSVITTLIVARPHSGGVLRASAERLIATFVGATIACLATFGRIIHMPELLLITLALAPLTLIVAHNSAFRTSMVAAVIVLSAPAASGAPLYVASARMLGVSLGAIIGALVSVTILPSRREIVVARATANLLADFPKLLRNALDPGAPAGSSLARASPQGISSLTARSRDRLEFRIRQALRELGMLIRDRADAPPVKGPAAAVVKFTVQMHADMVFLKRELQSIVVPEGQSVPLAALEALGNFAQAFDGVAAGVAKLARGRPAEPDFQALRETCGHAAQALRDECSNSEGARLMLRRLVEDLGGLVRSLQRS
jgi:uncharacterized membrane protein YccC